MVADSNKNKASATASISKFGPIKPTASQMNIINQGSSQTFNLTAEGSIGTTYFDNFIKKKNSMVNFNSQQPGSNSNSHRN